MPRGYIELADLKKLAVFYTDLDPDNPNQTINIQESIEADRATYNICVDNITPALNKNILTVYNNLPNKRIRIHEVYVYPKTLANHVVTLQLMYVPNNQSPLSSGSNVTSFTPHAADYPIVPAEPNTVIARTNPTVTPSNIYFGGSTFSVNTAGTYIIFERRGSTIILRPQPNAEGVTLRQTAGAGTTGGLTAHIILSVD